MNQINKREKLEGCELVVETASNIVRDSDIISIQFISGTDDETISGIGDEFANMAYKPGSFDESSTVQCQTILIPTTKEPIVITRTIGYQNDIPKQLLAFTYMSNLLAVVNITGDVAYIKRGLFKLLEACRFYACDIDNRKDI